MKKTHYYLVDTSVILKGAAVSELQFNVIDEQPFMVRDFKVRFSQVSFTYVHARYRLRILPTYKCWPSWVRGTLETCELFLP